MGVSLNGGTPKSSILIAFSIINHPFWGCSPYSWKYPDSEVNVSGPPIYITQGGFPKKVGIEIFPFLIGLHRPWKSIVFP